MFKINKYEIKKLYSIIFWLRYKHTHIKKWNKEGKVKCKENKLNSNVEGRIIKDKRAITQMIKGKKNGGFKRD